MLDRLERLVERMVDGGIAGVFRLRVQPAEIGRQLERAMLDGRVASVGPTLVPNSFEVRLHPEDAAVFAGWRDALGREMESWLAELAFARGLTTVGPIRVHFAEDPSVGRRSIRAAARFDGAIATIRDGNRLESELPPALRLLPLAPGVPRILLSSGQTSIGRAADNDVVLSDPEVSRHHARLVAAGSDWRVFDLGSTNGTWVNGERTAEASVSVGDELAFGGTRFTVGPG